MVLHLLGVLLSLSLSLLIMDKSSFYPLLCTSASVWQGLWRTEGDWSGGICKGMWIFASLFFIPAGFSWRVMRRLGRERKFSKTTASVVS